MSAHVFYGYSSCARSTPSLFTCRVFKLCCFHFPGEAHDSTEQQPAPDGTVAGVEEGEKEGEKEREKEGEKEGEEETERNGLPGVGSPLPGVDICGECLYFVVETANFVILISHFGRVSITYILYTFFYVYNSVCTALQ